MDPKDQILPGESAETPAASPAETTTPDEGSTSVSPQGAVAPTPEEERWNTLSGSSQERFRQVTRENNRLREEREALLRTPQQPVSQPFVTGTNIRTPETEAAVQRLSQVGIATDEKVEKVVDQRVANLVYQFEIDKLENKYNGENGLPKFDREEYRDYVARHLQYQNYAPEDVYKKMYDPEILEWNIQNVGKRSTSSQPSVTLKPTRTQVREEPMTPESIETRLSQPDGRQWYEDNRDKINTILTKNAGPSVW